MIDLPSPIGSAAPAAVPIAAKQVRPTQGVLRGTRLEAYRPLLDGAVDLAGASAADDFLQPGEAERLNDHHRPQRRWRTARRSAAEPV
jgi:hypothetical protein